MSGYYHGNPNYNTISSSNTQGEGGGNVFRIVMPHGQMVREESVQSPQIINIGPSGIRTVSGVGQRPHVRVMERQPSGGFRIIGGTGGGIQMVENPYSTMGPAQRSGSGGAQQMRIMPSGGQGGPFRIHVMQGGDTSSAPSTPPAYTSTVSYSTHTAQPHVYVHSESHAPTTYHTLTRSTSHGDSQDGAYDIPVRYQPRPPLANTGRSNSVDCGGVNINSGDGSTVYHTGPGRMSFSISGSGVQPVTPQTSTAATRGPVFYVRTNSGSREGTRESSPKIQVTRIKEALDGRHQQHNPNFDELIRSKLQNFVQGDHPQYLFRHQPQAAPTRATSTPPKHEEYIFVARPQFQTSTPSSATGTPTGTPTGTIRLGSGTPVYPGTPDGTMRSGPGTPDSTMRRGSTGSISSVGPGKKIVRTTREEIRDVGGGQTQTIREIHEELVDDEDEKRSKENVAPTIVTDNVDTWKSTTSNDSGNGSGDRNLFKKFRFKFDSIGNFGRSDSRESTGNKEMFHFQDFDDMVGGMSNLRLPARHQLVIPQATGTTCPYCNNNNPDCEYTCHNKCRQGVSLDCATSGQPESKPAVERQSRKQETVLAADQSSAQADDADSGYHTGSSTLTSRGPRGAKRPPGEWTLTREDLRRNIETFNNNNHGLIMSLQQDTNTFQGFIRVHMNLIRPINMSLSLRPPSIYDVIGQGEEEDEHNDGTHTTSFYLPKDTTKVIHINSDTTAQEVIKALLSKFKITDNPRKFALYERLEESSNKATMRRLEDEECPLPLCLCWTADGVEGLDCRRYVLQENDTGEIMWEAFSLPELENFLKILNREEEEYVEQVKGKYRMLKIHMQRRLVELDNKPTEETTLTDDKRRPVFV